MLLGLKNICISNLYLLTHNFKAKILFLQFLASCVGCFSTFYIWQNTKLNNIFVCEALVLIFCLLNSNKYNDMFFVACLSGISSDQNLPHPIYVFALACVVFIMFEILKKRFIGFGGRFGTIALSSNLIVCGLAALTNQNYEYPLYYDSFYKILNVYIYILGPFICGTSCLLSHTIHFYLHLPKFVAINLNGLLLTLLFNSLKKFPEIDGVSFFMSYGQIFIIFSHIGLLAAMLNIDFLFGYSFKGYIFFHYFIVGYVAGWVQISLIAFFLVGGKNGFMAFITCIFYVQFLKIFKKNNNFKKSFHSTTPALKLALSLKSFRQSSMIRHIPLTPAVPEISNELPLPLGSEFLSNNIVPEANADFFFANENFEIVNHLNTILEIEMEETENTLIEMDPILVIKH